MRIVAATIATTLTLLNAESVQAQDSDHHTRSITVNGEGKIAAAPDMATIRFSVVTRDKDPEKARSENADASSSALNMLRDLEISEEKIRLEQLALNPAREWDPDQRRHVDVGFEVTRGVSVETQDLDLVASIVARLVKTGANRINGVQYGLSNDQEAKSEALVLAVENARAKAIAMLAALGETLGPVMDVREQSVRVPSPEPRMYAAAAMEKAADASPDAYAPGELDIVANAVITFEIQ